MADTVRQLWIALGERVQAGRGNEEVWVDIITKGEPADLHSGDDENDDPIGEVTVNA